MIRLEEYERPDGTVPYKTWFDRLDSLAATRVSTATMRLREGNTTGIKWFAGIGELRIDWGLGYRIYLARDGDSLIILFAGGTKHRQSADIELAKLLQAEYKARKKA